MIVTLLAILELARLRRVRVTQDSAFGGISVVALEPEDAAHSAGAPPQAVGD
jgi:chromatin segregation and condensation protein Rec8/ScpA/Scc1 (kleisin family)